MFCPTNFYVDAAVLSDNGTLQGVYFSSGDGNPDLSVSDDLSQPDLVRLADKQEDFRHQGLLETISVADLQETDLYVFRESNGTLVTHRRGLRENELAQWRARQDGGVLEDSSEIYYQFLIRGPKSNSVTLSNDFSAFQSDAEMNPALHARASDHLRSQEPIKIIAVNRRSGYIGSVSTQYGDYDNNPGLISFPIDKLVMRPPNLKVLVERKMQIEAGLTQCNSTDCEEEYLIGYEGAATTDDTILTITTEWFDHDNAPLPEALGEYGYTGRLAKVTGNNTLTTDGGQLAQFAVKPGRHLQTIRLKGDYDTSEHFYLQINGESDTENPDFSTLGAAIDGPLKYRPKNFVPFLVPLEDQDATLRQYNAYRTLLRDDSIANDTLEDYGPVHRWFYRPEMQFSMYDLDVQNIFRQADEEGSEAIDIYPDDKPVIASSDDIITLAYDLIAQQFEALPYLGPGQELVFAFGEEEVLATLDENANVVFTNIEHFAALDPEDFLSIRLYSNNDPGNILWEYAFEYLMLDTQFADYDAASGETLYISADDPVVPLQSALLGYANRAEAIKEPVTLVWETTDGSLSVSSETNDDLGVFFNELSLPSIAGSAANVSVYLNGSYERVRLPRIEVVPGDPASASHAVSGKAHLSGATNSVLTFTIQDAHGNPVQDGTGVSFFVADSLELVDSDGATVNGQASATITGSDFVIPSSVSLSVGEVEYTVPVTVHPLNIVLSPIGDIDVGGSQNIEIAVTDSDGQSVPNLELEVGSDYGFITAAVVTTDAQGQASTIYTAPQGEGSGDVTVQAGFMSPVTESVNVTYPSTLVQDMRTHHASLIGDAAVDGAVNYTRYDGVGIDIGYPTQHTIHALGAEGDNVNITLGDAYDPNLPALTAFYMNTYDSNRSEDATGRYELNGQGIFEQNGTRLGAGTSFSFDDSRSAKLWADNLTLLNQSDNLAFSVEVFPHGSNGGEVVNLGQGAKVLRYTNSRFHYDVRTSEGSYTVSSDPVMAGRWHQVALYFENGAITLHVNGSLSSQNVTGSLDFDWTNNDTSEASNPENAHDLELGGAFNGRLNSLKWYDLSAQPLLTFSDGSTQQSAVVETGGSTALNILSTGRMHTNGSLLPMQRVAIVSDRMREYASLLSREAFTQIAGQYATTLAPDAPAINMAVVEQGGYTASAAYANNPSVNLSLFPMAHAQSGFLDFAWGAVNWILPLESFKIVFLQLGYLMGVGDGEFQADEFIIALVDVVTIFPPAKPLKLLVTPLRAMTRGLRNLNPKFMRYFAVSLSKVMKKAKKGEFDTLWNLLPFMVLAAEMYTDEEMREGLEFLMSTIDSADDVLSWVDYLALPANGWEGDGEIPDVDPFESGSSVFQSQLPLSFMFPQAHAAPSAGALRVSASVIAAALRRASRRVIAEQLDNVPDALAQVVKTLKNGDASALRRYVHDPSVMSASAGLLAKGGQRQLRNFLRGKTNARYQPLTILATVAYLEWEAACGKLLDQRTDGSGDTASINDSLSTLECNDMGLQGGKNRFELYRLYGRAFADTITGSYDEESPRAAPGFSVQPAGHGALFHLNQIASHQLLARGGGKKIKAIEGMRRIWLYKDEDGLGAAGDEQDQTSQDFRNHVERAYTRIVDIILEDSDGAEHWIELKSYKAFASSGPNREKLAALSGKKIAAWDLTTGVKPEMSLHRQFSLDRAATNVEHARLTRNDQRLNELVDVDDFVWHFQKFKWPRGSTTASTEINPLFGSASGKSSVFGGLTQEIANAAGDRKDLYQTNMGTSISASNHIKYASLNTFLSALAQTGFSEAAEALTQEIDNYAEIVE